MDKKKLEKQMEDIDRKRTDKGRKIYELQQELSGLNKERHRIQTAIWVLDKQPLFEITDHALIRYSERVHGSSLKQYEKMMREEIVNSIKGIDEPEVHISDGEYFCRTFIACIKDRKVLTIKPIF